MKLLIFLPLRFFKSRIGAFSENCAQLQVDNIDAESLEMTIQNT